MKVHFKSAVTLVFLSIICLIVALLLAAMKKLYIDSWFVLNRNVVTGFLSGLLLTSIFAFSNLIHAQRSHARERAGLLDDFTAETKSFLAFLSELQNDSGAQTIPSGGQYGLSQALSRLHDRANAILRSEKVSPRKDSAIQKGGIFVSPISKSECAFEQAFSKFEEHCNAAYQMHSSLPYLTDKAERDRVFGDFLRLLQELTQALDSESALQQGLSRYRTDIRKFLGEKRMKG